jgi:hypothetical protein
MAEENKKKRRLKMTINQRSSGKRMLLVVLFMFMGLSFIGTSQAQNLPVYAGKFTLSHQTCWDKTVLQPGDYTITIASTSSPIIAFIRNSDGRPVAMVSSGHADSNTKPGNELLIEETKDGQLRVHSLALADLGLLFIYDPALAREALREARASQTVPVTLAKR